MFLFGKLPVETQQELTMANKEDSSPEEIKTYLLRKYQYQNVLQQTTSTYQTFNQMSDNTTKREFTRSDQAQPKTETKRFEGQCFYCGKQGHRKQERRGRQRDEANGTTKPYAKQPANERKTIHQNTTRNSFARFADTLGIQLEIDENEFPNKQAPHMDNSHTNEVMTRKTKNGDVN